MSEAESSFTVVLYGGPQDGRVVEVDGRILQRGVLLLPEYDGGYAFHCPTPGSATFSQVEYHWDGTVMEDGARRFRRKATRR